MKELVDHDYLDRLTPEEKAWLEQFDDEYYGASFKGAVLHPEDARRELYKTKNQRNQDIYGRGLRTSSMPVTASADQQDWTDHKPSPEYREALNNFRAVLPDDGRKNPVRSHVFLSAQQKLDAEAGVLTREIKGVGVLTPNERMALSRTEKLKETYQIIMDLGHIACTHQFRGDEAGAAVRAIKWLEAYATKLDEKLKALGIDMRPEAKRGS